MCILTFKLIHVPSAYMEEAAVCDLYCSQPPDGNQDGSAPLLKQSMVPSKKLIGCCHYDD